MDKDGGVDKAAVYVSNIRMFRSDLEVNIHIRGALNRVQETVERFQFLTQGVPVGQWQHEITPVAPIDEPEPPVGVPAQCDAGCDNPLVPSGAHLETCSLYDLPQISLIPLEEFARRRGSKVGHTMRTQGSEVLHEVGRGERPARRPAPEVVVHHD